MPQQLYNAIYDTWDCIRTRVSVSGITMMPLAGIPPQSSIPIVLDGGMDYEVIQFIATRWGKPPVIPAPTTTNPNRVFLGGTQIAGAPIVGTGAYQLYRVSGAYMFGIIDPEGLLGDFMLGAAPMPNQPSSTNEYLPAGNIQSGMVNNNQGQKVPSNNATGTGLQSFINNQW